MTKTINVSGSPLIALFLQVSAGSERAVVEDLKKKKYSNVYKVFGQHDLLALYNAESLESDEIYYSCKGVHVTKPIASYNLNLPEYRSPENVSGWLAHDSRPLIGFIFLEMDKLFFSRDKAAKSSLNAYSLVIKCIINHGKQEGIDVAVFGGYGISDIYLVVKASSIDQIWFMARYCRSLRSKDVFNHADIGGGEEYFSIFSNTTTIPCISYNNIDSKSDKVTVDGVEGSCSASILMKCPSGYEKLIFNSFDSKKFGVQGLLGNSDGIAITKSPIPSKDLIEIVLELRQKWVVDHGIDVSTQTILYESEHITEISNREIRSPSVKSNSKAWNISGKLKKNNRLLANRIDNFIHSVNSCNQNRSHKMLIHDVAPYVEHLLDSMEQYDNLDNQVHCSEQEGILLMSIEAAENGLSQRMGDQGHVYSQNQSLPLPFGDGIFTSLAAIHSMISQIFNVWCNTGGSGQNKTTGFPTYNESNGFQMGSGEIFNVPLKALYDPCDASASWLTLTHEISHAIYLRLKVDTNDEDTLEIVESLNPEAPSDVVADQAYELFAHWFDYYHFYNESIDDYLRGVWGSWLKIPIVHMNIQEYLYRSVFIYFCHKNSEIKASMVPDYQEEIEVCATRLWQEHKKLIMPYINTNEYSYGGALDAMEAEGAMNLISRGHELVDLFNKYRSDSFKRELNNPYPLIDEHVQLIKNEELIEDVIENSYLLVKRVILESFDNTRRLNMSTALIVSLRNNINFS